MGDQNGTEKTVTTEDIVVSFTDHLIQLLKSYSGESDRVALYDNTDLRLTVSTLGVNDSESPFETAVSDPHYNEGKFVVVETYQNREDAAAGHERWVSIMESASPPEQLVDAGTNFFADTIRANDPDSLKYERQE